MEFDRQAVVSVPQNEKEEFVKDVELVRREVGLPNFSVLIRYLIKREADRVRAK